MQTSLKIASARYSLYSATEHKQIFLLPLLVHGFGSE
jgi:hypothetical protein